MSSLFNIKNGISTQIMGKEPVEKRLLIEELIPHTKNREYQKERVEALVYNIEDKGLLQPILVNIDTASGNKEILAGHHRVKAYQHLHYKTGNDDYLMIRSWVFEDLSSEEKLVILLSTNPDYDGEEEDKIKTLGYAQELYQVLNDKGEKPKGRRREWLMAITGFSEWFVRKHDEISEVVENSPQNEKQTEEESYDALVNKKYQRVIKTYQKMYDEVADIADDLSEEERMNVVTWLQDTLGLLP